MVWVLVFAFGSTGADFKAAVGRLVRFVGQKLWLTQYWPASKLQPPLSVLQVFHCLPSTVHLARAGALEEDAAGDDEMPWLEGATELESIALLGGAIELAARLLNAAFDVLGLDPPPPLPQALKRIARLRQVTLLKVSDKKDIPAPDFIVWDILVSPKVGRLASYTGF